MDGNTLNAGAVAGVKHIKNPINLALDVMNHSPHVMLAGEGAQEFALTQNYSLVAQEYFDTRARYEQLLKVRQKLAEQKPASQDYQASLMALDPEYKFWYCGSCGAL